MLRKTARALLPVAIVCGVVGFVGCQAEDQDVQEATQTDTRRNRSPDSPTGVKRNPAQPKSERPGSGD